MMVKKSNFMPTHLIYKYFFSFRIKVGSGSDFFSAEPDPGKKKFGSSSLDLTPTLIQEFKKPGPEAGILNYYSALILV